MEIVSELQPTQLNREKVWKPKLINIWNNFDSFNQPLQTFDDSALK